MNITDIRNLVNEKRASFVSDMLAISAIPSVNPKCGGSGEYLRSLWIADTLTKMGYRYEWIEIADSSVKEGVRVNIVLRIAGIETDSQTLWFIGHTDTVSPGDLSLWKTNPFIPTVFDNKIFGLGVEDNSQATITFLQVLKIIKEQSIQPRCNIGFLFVCDEECGSEFGLKALINMGYLKRFDEAIVPDYGSIDGSFIEIAEKSSGYVKFIVTGKQGHASTR